MVGAHCCLPIATLTAARKQLWSDMEQQGLVIKQEPYQVCGGGLGGGGGGGVGGVDPGASFCCYCCPTTSPPLLTPHSCACNSPFPPAQMRVPRSQRGGEIVEPRVREQWFVRMQPLAKPALEVSPRAQQRCMPCGFSTELQQGLM